MIRCDFSSVCRLIYSFLKAATLNQQDFLSNLFIDFVNADETSASYSAMLDTAIASKYMNGLLGVSKQILQFYRDEDNKDSLALSIEENILPYISDTMACVEAVSLLVNDDVSISSDMKHKLCSRFFELKDLLLQSTEDIAAYLSDIIWFAMERPFIPTDTNNELATYNKLSPIISERIIGAQCPKPVSTFVGRTLELEDLHNIISKNNCVFITGEAGIGKSELIKKYVSTYKKCFNNILYFNYYESLYDIVCDMDFVDDLENESKDTRFKRHYRYLRTLKQDTLIIIDNFDCIDEGDEFLDTFINHNYKVIFTTRGLYRNYSNTDSYELKELGTYEELMELFKTFYTENSKDEIIWQIIEALHKHTLTIELSARLLENGMATPNALLEQLLTDNINISYTDKITLKKDGHRKKQVFYQHLHSLFHFYQYDEALISIIRNMSLVASCGIHRKLFAMLNDYKDFNSINALIDMGVIRIDSFKVLSMSPLTSEFASLELSPDFDNCSTMLNNIEALCLMHGVDFNYYKELADTIISIATTIPMENTTSHLESYVRFLENAHPFMEKYSLSSGMKAIEAILEKMLNCNEIEAENLSILLYDFKASYELIVNNNIDTALDLELKALSLVKDITAENALLAANINSNIGYLYHRKAAISNNKNKSNKLKDYLSTSYKHMQEAYIILDNYDLVGCHDSIALLRNYANLLSDMGDIDNAINALRKCITAIKATGTDDNLDIGWLHFDLAQIAMSAGLGDIAKVNYKKAALILGDLLSEISTNVIE